MNQIQKFQHGELIEQQVLKITEFLDILGLPSDNIIASNDERSVIGNNLPNYMLSLPDEVKTDARYLSKFVVGAGFGLFDYALNSIWNEVVLALRNKAITYGLDMFFNSAVGGKLREAYNDENDLSGLRDNVLLDTSKKLELISETTYKKLSHILDMRNDIGISHPTNYVINAYELLGWLQTCIKEVIQDKPSAAAIQVKAFIDNLKKLDVILDAKTIATFEPQLKSLATHHCDNILRTIFGIYVSEDSDQTKLKNISLISKIVWDNSSDETRYKLGILLEGYNNNLHKTKYSRGSEFFNLCSGNSYKTKNERIIALYNLSNDLKNAHSNWDNYYHEVPIIEKIMSYINKTKDIPNEISKMLIHNVILCRIGKCISYCSGVSPNAKPYYNRFLELIGEIYFPEVILELTSFDIQHRISTRIGCNQTIEILNILRKSLVNEKYIECTDYLINNFSKTEKSIFNTEFQKLSSSFLKWSN